MLTTDELLVFHTTEWVMSAVLLSAYVPMAVNCWAECRPSETLAGDTVIETRAGIWTVREAEPEIDPLLAVIVGVLTSVPVAKPPTTLAPAEAFQLTELEMSCTLASVKVPCAMNCCVDPLTIVAVDGVTAIESNVAGCTVRTAAPLMEPLVAVIVEALTTVPVARPAGLMLAPLVTVQVTELNT